MQSSRGCGGLVLALILFGTLSLGAPSLHAQEFETLELPGLERPVEILIDAWGIPHIYAETEHDLFFAQGYNAARDRLFQLEIWRRQATGTVAEVLGPREVDRDLAARLFRFSGDMDAEMRHYHERGHEIIPAFVAGINAYVDRVRANPDLLPMEFRLLQMEPGHWTPEVVVSRHQGLLGNAGAQLSTGRAVHLLGSERVHRIEHFHPHPNRPDIELDPAIDGDHLVEHDILRLYSLWRSGLRFQPEDIIPEQRAEAADHARLARVLDSESALLEQMEFEDFGSNNWVVSGTRAQDDYPLMVNDPHRAQQAPALRYWAHLVGPGWNVIGGGEPAIPGISIGHNGFGAWGLTIFRMDHEELYVYETNAADPTQYRYQGGWETWRSASTPSRFGTRTRWRWSFASPGTGRWSTRTPRPALPTPWLRPGGKWAALRIWHRSG